MNTAQRNTQKRRFGPGKALLCLVLAALIFCALMGGGCREEHAPRGFVEQIAEERMIELGFYEAEGYSLHTEHDTNRALSLDRVFFRLEAQTGIGLYAAAGEALFFYDRQQERWRLSGEVRWLWEAMEKLDRGNFTA